MKSKQPLKDWEKDFDWLEVRRGLQSIIDANGVKCESDQFLYEDLTELCKKIYFQSKSQIVEQILGKIIEQNYDEQFGTFDVDGIGDDVLKLDELDDFFKRLIKKQK